MVTVKMLKPYYIKIDARTVRVILAYQYFSVLINGDVYQFIPMEAKEIRINRKTKKIENIGARFAFQKGKDIIYIAMTELISLPDFLLQLYAIVESYYSQDVSDINVDEEVDYKVSLLINELERLNVKRLIDKSLDERDEDTFKELVKML